MKLHIYALALLSSANSFGWGAPKIAPADQRQKSYVEDTNITASDSFKKASEWFAKSFGDSKEAIRLNDSKDKKIVAKGNTACDALKLGNGYGKNQKIEFTLTFEAKDKRVRILFEDVVGTDDGSYDTGSRPSKQEEMDKVTSACLDPLKDALIGAIKAKKADNW